MNTNNSMATLLLDRLIAGTELTGQLRDVAEAPLIEVGGAVVIESLYRLSKAPQEVFPDITGYECFVNHLHIDDYIGGDQLAPGLLVTKLVLERFNEQHGGKVFRAIIGCNEDGCTVRFHVLRQGEAWLSQDLQGYLEESILVFDSSELLHSGEE